MAQNEELQQENQSLKDEINRLKGEHGSLPPKTPKGDAPVTNGQHETEKGGKKQKPRSKNHKKGGQKARVAIDRIVPCLIDKSALPPDAEFKHYDTIIQQDLKIERNNTMYKIPVWYSASEKKTYRGELPADCQGAFGGQLKAWLQLLHHYGDMTQGRLSAMMESLGIAISTGSISNFVLSNAPQMEEEQEQILRSGIKRSDFAQMDGTKSWEAGEGKSTQVICAPRWTVYYTMPAKSRASVLEALQGKPQEAGCGYGGTTSPPRFWHNRTLRKKTDARSANCLPQTWKAPGRALKKCSHRKPLICCKKPLSPASWKHSHWATTRSRRTFPSPAPC